MEESRGKYTFIARVPHLKRDDGSAAEDVVLLADAASGEYRYTTLADWELMRGQGSSFAGSVGAAVTSRSSNDEKLALFRSLFKGRTDVFAHGYRMKTGGIGYTPACENEWKRGVCPKVARKGVKCADCGSRSFAQLTEQRLLEHFSGVRGDFKDVIGIYVLDDECKTSLLVADFDDGPWRMEAKAYQNAAKRLGIDAIIERSRSGSGAHVWIFLEEPTDASMVRKLGFLLIENAMDHEPALSFSAYDRLFPAQDTIAKGGFGNLIALPFQGRARVDGNSVFLDENFEPIEDQWAFLSRVKKLSASMVEELVASHCPNGSEASLAARPPVLINRDSEADVTPTPAGPIVVRRSNLLHVDVAGLSTSVRNRILRVAAYGNPEFAKKQAMRQSVYGTPRIICLAEGERDIISLPRGCEQVLCARLKDLGFAVQVVEERIVGDDIDVSFCGELRAGQAEAIDELLKSENGILSAPTGFGKTVVAAALIARLRVRTLVIVPRSSLLEQWRESLERFLDVREEPPVHYTKTGRKSRNQPGAIGQIGGGKILPSGIVDVATFQSLTEDGEIDGTRVAKELLSAYDMVIVDECHHAASSQLEMVLKAVRSRYVYGLTATPKRSDGLDKSLYMLIGPILCVVDSAKLAQEQDYSRILLPRFTNMRIPSLEPGSSYNQVIDALCEHEERNRIICQDVAEAYSEGRTVLVVTKRKEHARVLCEKIGLLGCDAYLLIGEGTSREKGDRLKRVKEIPAGKPFVIVATGSYAGEGFDEPRLDMLVLAAPISWEGIVTQYSGRLHRESAGKTDVVVCDYIDASIPMLDRMYKQRLKCYRSLGYSVLESSPKTALRGEIVDARSFQRRFIADIDSASQSIWIAAPYAHPKWLNELSESLSRAIARGISVEISLRSGVEGLSDEVMRGLGVFASAGCRIAESDEARFGLAVFDGEIAWYGSLPLLSYAMRDDCSLRLVSAEVVESLMSTR